MKSPDGLHQLETKFNFPAGASEPVPLSGGGPAGLEPVILLAYHFLPSPEVGAKRISALAEFLNARGHKVAVVSAFEGLNSLAAKDSRRATLSEYSVALVPDRRGPALSILIGLKRFAARAWQGSARPPDTLHTSLSKQRKNNVLYRTFFSILHLIDDKKWWSIRAARRINHISKNHRARWVIVSAPPMSSLFGAVRAARKLGLPVIVDIRDPLFRGRISNDETSGFFDRWARQLLERYVLNRAAAIITTSPGLRDHLREQYPARAGRITCILNGFDGDPCTPRRLSDGRLVIVYAGALYLNRDPFPFLEALEQLLEDATIDPSQISVIFAGECEQYRGESLRDWLSKRRCSKVVTIYERLGSSELNQLYDKATLLLNFAEGQPTQVPAKTYELLARGREVLVICELESDTARVVSGLAGVFCSSGNDKTKLVTLLRDFYERHALRRSLSAPVTDSILQFARTVQNEQFVTVLEHVRKQTDDLR